MTKNGEFLKISFLINQKKRRKKKKVHLLTHHLLLQLSINRPSFIFIFIFIFFCRLDRMMTVISGDNNGSNNTITGADAAQRNQTLKNMKIYSLNSAKVKFFIA